MLPKLGISSVNESLVFAVAYVGVEESHLLATAHEETISQLHNIRLVHARHLSQYHMLYALHAVHYNTSKKYCTVGTSSLNGANH